MSSNARRRVMKEYKKMLNKPPEMVLAEPTSDIMLWRAVILGLVPDIRTSESFLVMNP